MATFCRRRPSVRATVFDSNRDVTCNHVVWAPAGPVACNRERVLPERREGFTPLGGAVLDPKASTELGATLGDPDIEDGIFG